MNLAAPTAPRTQIAESEFLTDVLHGLSRRQKTLPSKYFYDRTGSELFDRICELPEYYPTRTELSIMHRWADEMGRQLGDGVRLIEYGSGSSVKTRLLLDHLINPAAYVPVDVSGDHLHLTARRLQNDYEDIEILPVCADFTAPFDLPKTRRPATHDAVYFPGSTIGNFEPDQAMNLLSNISEQCGCGGGLLIGIDLKKDARVLEPAYNDASGVTAAFNLNLLHRINQELDGTFNVDEFHHTAVYNDDDGRIEMYLESNIDQTVHIADRTFEFSAGERICTEYSHKYTVDQFAQMAAQTGLTLRQHWTDDRQYFAVLHFARLNS